MDGKKQKDVAAIFSITQACVHYISANKTWIECPRKG
jgi:hypothetical protein